MYKRAQVFPGQYSVAAHQPDKKPCSANNPHDIPVTYTHLFTLVLRRQRTYYSQSVLVITTAINNTKQNDSGAGMTGRSNQQMPLPSAAFFKEEEEERLMHWTESLSCDTKYLLPHTHCLDLLICFFFLSTNCILL